MVDLFIRKLITFGGDMREDLEIGIDTENGEWIDLGLPNTVPGENAMMVLRISEENGTYTALIKSKAGTYIPPHRHLGEVVVFVLEGEMHFRGGVVGKGGYNYEPAGAVHPATHHLVDTVYLAHVANGVIYFNSDGSDGPIYDWMSVKAKLDAHNASRSQLVN